MTFPLRTRITALYFAVLVVSFLSFAWISDFAFRNSIETTVNDAAKSNLDSVRGVLLRVPSKGSSEVEDELNNLSGLWAGAGLLQVTNEGKHVVASKGGHWIQLDEPDLVIESIREVVESVGRRNPQ
jgi:pimeloyl-ACP methyl ester carboxylesterase